MTKLPVTMKALVAYSADTYVLETAWPRPVAGPGEIIIKVEACGSVRAMSKPSTVRNGSGKISSSRGDSRS
jgi:hypothetical protein